MECLKGKIWIGIGIAISGFFIANGLEKFKVHGNPKVLQVKGLAEKVVKANMASWDIEFYVSDKDFSNAQIKFENAFQKIKDFLAKHEFQANEIEIKPMKVTFFSKTKESDESYQIDGKITVNCEKVEAVSSASMAILELLRAGVMLTKKDRYEEEINPKYWIKNFDEMRPQLFDESIKSAYNAAKQFTEKTGTKIHSVQSMDQGSIREEGKGIEKKLRLVSFFTFNID